MGLAALQHDWGWWARGKQQAPEGAWRSWGLCTGRGFGKTRSVAEWIVEEVMAGRARRIGLCAQNEDKTHEVMIDGPSGLIARSPPWFKPVFRLGRLEWPNGALAFPYTPEVPGDMRGPEHDLVWVSEVVVWPSNTRDEAFSNLRLGLRLGLGRMVWDTTPKRRHPIVRYLIERAADRRHIVVRGSTRDNADNLTAGAIEEWEREYGGTARGREELDGEFIDESDDALFRQEWIERARRAEPPRLRRRVLAVDPGISMRRSTDATGIVEVGIGEDDQIFVLANLSERVPVEEWSARVVARYLAHECDCIVVERNRGGDLCVAVIRAAARERGVAVEVVKPDYPTRHAQRVVYVKEVIGSSSKESRADAIVPLYEKGRVSHVDGADLESLEMTMTTWVPDGKGASPNDLDALVYAVSELASLEGRAHDYRAGFVALPAVREALSGIRVSGTVLPRMTGRGGGSRI